MKYSLDRRTWLKSSVAAALGLTLQGKTGGAGALNIQSGRDANPQGHSIRLKSNENPYGISAKTREAVISSLGRVHRYPHDQYHLLRSLIGEREHLPPEAVILGAGSTEVMVTLIQSWGKKGEVVLADPTYFDFISYADTAGCRLNPVPLDKRYLHNLQEMENKITSSTSLVYICNPNNPTGTIVAGSRLKDFLADVPPSALVLVDEAYHEYTDDPSYESMSKMVYKQKNLVVTRTFSKIYGLAGMRIGYGLAHPDTVQRIKKFSRNFAPIAYSSLQAALAAYADISFIKEMKTLALHAKQALYQELRRLGILFFPSQTNFVIFETPLGPETANREWEKRGILIRPFSFLGKNWIRVSMGTSEEMEIFTRVLREMTAN